jgi:EAL domain-containing protein (putative c-di-GMP-specific phosphodiesterase class I)
LQYLRQWQWVLNTACVQLNIWQQLGNTRHLVLAINVSAKQFRQKSFVDEVRSTVQNHNINPHLLKVELTESMLVGNVDDTIENMQSLKQIGIQISLDDFGTGYSSLQYLKRLPLDQIKIDQSFVRNIGIDKSDNTIVDTIIRMTTGFDMEVIAEGVETEAQFEFLSHHGCNKFQGYLYSKPVPIEQFQKFILLN